jgi:ribosomal protein L29
MADFKSQSIEELHKQVADKREALRQFRFGGAGSRSRNVREGRTHRKEIARMLTEVSARKNVEKNAAKKSKKAAAIASVPKKA